MEPIVINEKYYSFKEVLSSQGIPYSYNGNWMKLLYKKYDMDCPEGDEFYQALGLFLNDSHIALCTNIECMEDKLLMIINKNNMILEDYKAYRDAINQEITSLKSSSVTRFNDTPTEEGDFTADKYTSNITQIENSTDYDINTKVNIARRRLKHLIESYCDEFKGMIIWTK